MINLWQFYMYIQYISAIQVCSRSLNSNSSSKRAAISSLCHLFYSVIYLKVLSYPFSEFNSSVLKEIDHEVPWWQTQSDLFGLPKNTIWEQMQPVKWKGKKNEANTFTARFIRLRKVRPDLGVSAGLMVHLPHSYIMLFAYLVMIMVQNDRKHFNHQKLGRLSVTTGPVIMTMH